MATVKAKMSLKVKYGWKGNLSGDATWAGFVEVTVCNKIKCTKIIPVIKKGNK